MHQVLDKTMSSTSTEAFPMSLALRAWSVDGFHLLDHDKAGYMGVIRYCHMKGITTIRACQGHHDRKARLFVKEGVAHHQCRATPFLLMA